ncbi:MAG: hypothetical protein RBR67_15530, partial [Desulfobacterium sp.]|nr:hypothetical protein [Desulfobacterium sp.]
VQDMMEQQGLNIKGNYTVREGAAALLRAAVLFNKLLCCSGYYVNFNDIRLFLKTELRFRSNLFIACKDISTIQ